MVFCLHERDRQHPFARHRFGRPQCGLPGREIRSTLAAHAASALAPTFHRGVPSIPLLHHKNNVMCR